MNKPRIAIEFIDKHTKELRYTQYHDITETEEIKQAIIKAESSEWVEIGRFYYSNNYGIEIEF
jgi:hypothetical protein